LENNRLKTGEICSILEKRRQQTTFKSNLIIPYLFKKPLGLKRNKYFKQIALSKHKTGLDLGYFINYNTKIIRRLEQQHQVLFKTVMLQL
jgi:hypothetical protein